MLTPGKMGGQNFKTRTVYKTFDPEWNEGSMFLLNNIKSDKTGKQKVYTFYLDIEDEPPGMMQAGASLLGHGAGKKIGKVSLDIDPSSYKIAGGRVSKLWCTIQPSEISTKLSRQAGHIGEMAVQIGLSLEPLQVRPEWCPFLGDQQGFLVKHLAKPINAIDLCSTKVHSQHIYKQTHIYKLQTHAVHVLTGSPILHCSSTAPALLNQGGAR
jgi:hypothetical protein